MTDCVYVVQDVFEGIAGVFSNHETAHAAAAAAERQNDGVYNVLCLDVDHSGPDQWAAARELEAALKSERERRAKLVDDVATLQAACEDVPRVPAFEMPADRDAFDAAWGAYDAERNDVRLRVREAAKTAGVHNYAAELVVVSDKLGYAE